MAVIGNLAQNFSPNILAQGTSIRVRVADRFTVEGQVAN